MPTHSKRSIAIISQSHLCRNPRVVKEALALAHAGYEVSVNTIWSSGALLEEDRKLIEGSGIHYQAFVNLAPGLASPFQRQYFRMLRRLGLEAMKRTRRENIHALGYGAGHFLKKARRIKADLIIAHLEVGTFCGAKLAAEGRKVGFDFEDWYSEDLLPEARKTRPVQLLKKAEAAAMTKACYATTTSHALAIGLQKAFGGLRPEVIYNVFPAEELKSVDGKKLDRTDPSIPSLYWFSQAIGPGRGLELLITALSRVTLPAQLHLRGAVSEEYKQALTASFPFAKGHLLYFHGLIPPAQLLSRMAEHDVGFALEDSAPPSRDLTITNKILHYLLGGLVCIATPTKGQLEVEAIAPGAVRLLPERSPEPLAALIQHFVTDPGELEKSRRKAREAALQIFCWERQSPHFLKIVGNQFR